MSKTDRKIAEAFEDASQNVEAAFKILEQQLGPMAAEEAFNKSFKRSAIYLNKIAQTAVKKKYTVNPEKLKGSGFRPIRVTDGGIAGAAYMTYGDRIGPHHFELEHGKHDTTGRNRAPIRVKYKKNGAFQDLEAGGENYTKTAFLWGTLFIRKAGAVVPLKSERVADLEPSFADMLTADDGEILNDIATRTAVFLERGIMIDLEKGLEKAAGKL